MTPREAVARQVRRLRPTAKFVAVEHSDDFLSLEVDMGEGFFTANLYDERIDANMLVTKYGRVMIQNTYISSFAYNLFLCRLNDYRHPSTPGTLDRLLAHNFKKFFAEQIYRQTNRIPARALLLETLLYEQAMMVDVFVAKRGNLQLAEEADQAAMLMSFALTMHEMGHYYLETRPETWHAVVHAEPEAVGILHERVSRTESAKLTLEFQCDVFAVICCLSHYETGGRATFALRTVVFAFAAYAAMYSAEATAKATAALWDAEPPEEVDFRSVAVMPPVDHPFRSVRDAMFARRAGFVMELCASLAVARGVELFGDDDPFPLAPTVVRDLAGYVGRVFDCDDENARRMSNLVAHALHGHDVGTEYLYLRSKTFQSNRPEPLV